jgi:hypothetical protein
VGALVNGAMAYSSGARGISLMAGLEFQAGYFVSLRQTTIRNDLRRCSPMAFSCVMRYPKLKHMLDCNRWAIHLAEDQIDRARLAA